jgi:hypothetical protein
MNEPSDGDDKPDGTKSRRQGAESESAAAASASAIEARMQGAEDDEQTADEEAAEDEGSDDEAAEDEARERSADTARAQRAAQAQAPRGAATITVSRASIYAVAALAAGAAAGWFGHIEQAKAQLRAESVPAPAGSVVAGPCGDWERKICAGGGERSMACQQAKGASELLTPSACEVAMAAVPATLAKIKAGRATCDSLVKKLCTDLPQGSPACEMVTERTGSFPSKRCQEMLDKYDQVLQEVRQIDQQMAGKQERSGHPGSPAAPEPIPVPQHP